MTRLAPLPPLERPPLAATVHDEWRRRREEQGGRPTADGTALRGSYAHQCGRRVAFSHHGRAADIPDSDFNLMTWEYGQFGHDIAQKGLTRYFPQARIEVPVTYRPDRDLSGNIDGEYVEAGRVVDVEIKTMRQYGWDLATGVKPARAGEPAAGPKVEHLEQVGMYSLAPYEIVDGQRVERQKAAAVHMVYFAKDTGRIAEWVIPVDEPLTHLPGAPTVTALAEAEIARLEQVIAAAENDELPARVVPGFGLVEDPSSARAPWNCRYCPFQPTCSKLPAGPVPVAVLTPEREQLPPW